MFRGPLCDLAKLPARKRMLARLASSATRRGTYLCSQASAGWVLDWGHELRTACSLYAGVQEKPEDPDLCSPPTSQIDRLPTDSSKRPHPQLPDQPQLRNWVALGRDRSISWARVVVGSGYIRQPGTCAGPSTVISLPLRDLALPPKQHWTSRQDLTNIEEALWTTAGGVGARAARTRKEEDSRRGIHGIRAFMAIKRKTIESPDISILAGSSLIGCKWTELAETPQWWTLLSSWSIRHHHSA
ncbi:hypothetical protein SODALDRAFT_354193 [Sodiomyces alkalinus F11]|uniref:Uncharacterized protein n=1 Tax=Sodiomyces alkalinus (strain CBS 110278 / VKM F-3762 / F11) TaxID=1314773 RepID=A0A3N2Q5U9_SODAK|nr:hypothetical protein SODALDRAFT_354193 [Sodiomyces alkalinus F11]ROT42076.1 hypothetical protein SODALDRAFT_354193 [Sodiomyces alkalinus F11]